MEEAKTFGLNLKAIRTAWNLSQEEFGEVIGVTRQQLSRYERGIVCNPTYSVLQKTADFAGIPIEELLHTTLFKEDLYVAVK